MRYLYEINCRRVGGLETSYEEWVVSLQDETGREVERVAAFMHEACADGLRNQLQRAYEHGWHVKSQEDTAANLKASLAAGNLSECPEADDWKASIDAAHDSLNRLEDVALARLAESFEGAEQAPATHRAPYVDIEGKGGTTRVHLLADDPTPSKRRDTRPGLGKRTFLPPKMDKIDD